MAIIFCNNCGASNSSGGKFCFACGQKLQQGVVAPTPVAPTGLLPSHTLLKQRYRILQSVGKGGMGAVYMAQDTNLGGRLVAIKEMSQTMLLPQEAQNASENFKKEAYLLAGLHHPNLPSIHDHFEDQGRWYLVMSFIEGETLGDYMKSKSDKKVSLEEGLQIGLTLCDVLAYLHAHKPPIIFRDLKPSNIMCTPEGRIYLIDFGIARHFKPGQAKDTANYGSAGFSPPEQYGQAQTSPRSDIYSLGATLYYLLSGYSPSLSPFRLPPLQSKAPTLPTGLSTFITQMLSLDESMRPTDIQEVKKELGRFTSAQSSTLLKPIEPTIPASLPPRVLTSAQPPQNTSTPSPLWASAQPPQAASTPSPIWASAQSPQNASRIKAWTTSASPPKAPIVLYQRQIQATPIRHRGVRVFPASQTLSTILGLLSVIIGCISLFFSSVGFGLLFILPGFICLIVAATRQSKANSKRFFTDCGIILSSITALTLLLHIGGLLIFLIGALLSMISLTIASFQR